jgi:predicted transcriptional regulator
LDHTNSDDEIPLACLWNRVEGSDTNFDQMFEIESTLPIEEPSNEKGEISLLDKIKVEDDSETEESIGTGSQISIRNVSTHEYNSKTSCNYQVDEFWIKKNNSIDKNLHINVII